MEYLFTFEALVSLLTLTTLEIVLGIDNVVFISIVAGKLPEEKRAKARNWGLILALVPRVILLLFIGWIIGLKEPLIDFYLFSFEFEFSGKGLILLAGGLFLLYSSTMEIHHKLEGGGEMDGENKPKKGLSFSKAIFQIVTLNVIFSFDSVLTAVGLARHIEIMVIAVVISSLIMMAFAGPISSFVEKHPTVKMLALSFLLMIGFLLVAESIVIDGNELHVPKGYVYFAMGFSLFVELLNLKMKKKTDPVKLKTPFDEG